MAEPILEFESLLHFLTSNHLEIHFFQSYPDVPRGWSLEDMKFTDADLLEEDQINYCGFSNVEKYKQELEARINNSVVALGNKLSRFGDQGKLTYLKTVNDRIAGINIESHSNKYKLDISYKSESPRRTAIIEDNMADPYDLLSDTSKKELAEFIKAKGDALHKFQEAINSLGNKNMLKEDSRELPEGEALSEKQVESDQYLDTKELAEYLSVSVRSIASWRAEGKLSFTKIGRKIIYSKADVEEFTSTYKIKRYK